MGIFKSSTLGNWAAQFSADGFGSEPVYLFMPGDSLNFAGGVAPNGVGGTFPFQPAPVLGQV